MKFAMMIAAATEAKNIMGSGEVKRTITGDWVDQFYGTHRNRRGDIDGEKGFRPMAAMKLYLTGMGSNRQDPQDLASFDSELDALEAKYTSYGCYCWINGMSDGVIGGGKTKDVTDHHCKELYRCYKCVNNDYAKNYTDVSYTVDFTMKDGERALDCSVNSKQDAENICECDKRFAENIAAAEGSCTAGEAADPEWGEHCMSEDFRTGNAGGSFDPQNQCDKQFHGHDKAECCGFYPNRYPYDINENDCCRTTISDSKTNPVEIFSIQQKGVCSGAGGEVVISAEGDPHNYLVLAN